MSCSRETWIINRYIDRVIDNNLVNYEYQWDTLAYIGYHEANKYIVFAYATNNYEKIFNA